MGEKYVTYNNLPGVCKTCRFRDSDSADEYSVNYHYCTKNLFLPTKKNECSVKNKEAAKRQGGAG